MGKSLPTTEFQIPKFETLGSKLKCCNCTCSSACPYFDDMRKKGISPYINSKYDCIQFQRIIFIIKLILEIVCFTTIAYHIFIYFGGFWSSLLKFFSTSIVLFFLDFLSDKLIKYFCVNSERKRKEKYNIKVEKIRKENEAIRKANAGITQEIQKFLDNSDSLFNELNQIADSIKDKVYIYNEKVSIKFKAVLEELKVLNKKLSKNTFESSYISTLYEIHLPKLLEYSKQFLNYLNLNTLTEKQIIEFIKLLEVFRVKISSHTRYIQDKEEDDFIIKITALNQDVIPNYDGNEEQNNE